MNTKYIFTAIAVVIVVGIGFFIYSQGQDNNNVSNQTNNVNNADSIDDINSNNAEPANTNTSNTNIPTNETAAPSTNEPAPHNPDVAVFEIAYNGTAFSPSQLTIKNGDVVIFKNESDKSFWPASGPHPQHTNYPEFDPKKAIPAGQDFQFKFTKTGEWGFHDHLNSTAFGKITVQ